ncbi:MAG: hypothetical protein ACR2Q4_19825 [Geminicoccaceae bacterium]
MADLVGPGSIAGVGSYGDGSTAVGSSSLGLVGLDLKALDVVYISYDEPRADQSFAEIQAICPRAKRVHGVKGFDAAHKAAARLANTEHFITIDGDNVDVDPLVLDGSIALPPGYHGCVAAFSARNRLNGLIYGNGGLKVWPRALVLEMRTHENADHQRNATEFCWGMGWYKLDCLASDIEVTTTPFQAFRAGFREGVKLVTPDGLSPREAFPDLPLKEAFGRHVWTGNADRLSVWCSVGADVEHGLFAIYGARLGCAMLHFDDWDPGAINDYEGFKAWWRDVIAERLGLGLDHQTRLRQEIKREGYRLRRGLGLNIADLDAEGSIFYKSIRPPAEIDEGLVRTGFGPKAPDAGHGPGPGLVHQHRIVKMGSS